ncbi:MAG: transporter substrate-binding domain-containing protein, partial [Paramuribaculum sp.]|nr:transporter substrate-binding domain-containing protein [Paramuribaculum sp.]
MNSGLSNIKVNALAAIAATSILFGCSGRDTNSAHGNVHAFPDTLRVGTLYSPTSYFIYREETMGYDYDLVKRLAQDKGMVLRLKVASSLQRVVEMLDSGTIDLIAYEVPITGEYRSKVVPCGIESITHQVLVQPKKSYEGLISDVTQLVGRTVYVEKDSKYHHRMENLNEELGGGIEVIPIDRDTLITEDLIAMVSRKEIPLTIVDSDIARLNKTYFNDLDITLQISFAQRAAWGVAHGKEWLADSITEWMAEEQPRKTRDSLLKRYFEKSKSDGSRFRFSLDLSRGYISPFDHLFKKYAGQINWDWRLLASQGYCESHFDSTQVSWAGARGIMQLMPSVARSYGLDENTIAHNEPNIEAAAKIVQSLNKVLAPKVPDPEERKKFIVAAYNSGIAHILDAIAIAKKYGLNPEVWEGQVENALLMKSNPDVYN